MFFWTDPGILLTSLRAANHLIFVQLGFLLWELIATIPFDFSFIARRRRVTWSYVFYVLARVAALASLWCGVLKAAWLSKVPCKAVGLGAFIFGYAALAFAAALLLQRTIAICGQTRWVLFLTLAMYTSDLVVWFYEISKASQNRRCDRTLTLSQMRFFSVPNLSVCATEEGRGNNLLNIVLATAFDIVCLILIVVTLQQGIPGRSLWKLLYQQGVIWFVVVAFGHTIAITFLVLDLNQPITEMTMMFAMLNNVICATRMYRGLAIFGDERCVSALPTVHRHSSTHFDFLSHPSLPRAVFALNGRSSESSADDDVARREKCG
ncbi:hypothetical protein EXIGLDRAFT_760047 [Exidia glandulosa HHB12029]|uniref:Uncharacterized protein n=1 Tax=Exidia glandulosa HHB12029 TaxID=1314781 RepID=A0A166BLD7_EXIGL|nr:hypothetical protein EXIGLDRAFT_760047 [Exidia glandulosa HHB12029]